MRGTGAGPVRPFPPDAMRINTTTPADAGKLSAVEQHHLLTIRALSARRHRAALVFARNLLQLDIEAGTARSERVNVGTTSTRGAAKHLILVVDNDRGQP